MIRKRPVEIDTKELFGVWEVDIIIDKNHKTAILTNTERKSQFELIFKIYETKSIAKQIIKLLAALK